MTRSASTRRIRITQAYFLALVAASAFVGPAPLPTIADRLVGLVALLLVCTACFGRIWCSAFIAGHKDARLVTSGPYSLCRHPLYLLSLVGGVGLGVATRSVTLTSLTIAVLGTLFAQAMKAEEALLAGLHGDAFARYVASTPRFWPSLRGWRLEASVELRPTIFWKAFLDAGTFIVLYALVELAHTLRAAGALPVLLELP